MLGMLSFRKESEKPYWDNRDKIETFFAWDFDDSITRPNCFQAIITPVALNLIN